MFCANVIVIQICCFFVSKFEDFFHFSCECWISKYLDLRTIPHKFFNFIANSLKVDIQVSQNIDSYTLTELKQSKQDVFCPQIVVVEPLGFLFCQLNDLFCSISKFVKHRPLSCK